MFRLGPWESPNTVNKSFPAEGCEVNFWKKEIMYCYSACSSVWFLVHNDEFSFILIDDAVLGSTVPKDCSRCSGSCADAPSVSCFKNPPNINFT
jgi:hypothetical protein